MKFNSKKSLRRALKRELRGKPWHLERRCESFEEANYRARELVRNIGPSNVQVKIKWVGFENDKFWAVKMRTISQEIKKVLERARR